MFVTKEPYRAIDWKAGLYAGLIAGALDEMLLMAAILLQGGSVWGAARMTAAIVLGEGVLPPPDTFDLGVVAASTFVHFGLSMIYGLIIAWLIQPFAWGGGLAMGAAFGFAVYFANYYLIAPAMFLWFVDMRSAVTAFVHVAFGLIAAASYLWLRKAPGFESRSGAARRQALRPVALDRRQFYDRRGRRATSL